MSSQEENHDLISVIVPIYKVELYLTKCVDSILGQTYQNIEVILIDDGSPDACPAICDRYAEQDTRVRVIHKENGGLSSARNAGLDAATGGLVVFTDPDDWMESDMLELLVGNMRAYESDIAECGWFAVKEGVAKPEKFFGESACYSNQEAMYLLLDGKCYLSVCNKLFRKNLFETVRFPEGRVWEDGWVMPKLFGIARTVSVLGAHKYYYLRQRAGSIMYTARLNMEYSVQAYEVARERYLYIEKNYPMFISKTIPSLWYGAKQLYKTAVSLSAAGEPVDVAMLARYFEEFKQLTLYKNGKFQMRNLKYVSLHKYILLTYAPKLYLRIAAWLKKADCR